MPIPPPTSQRMCFRSKGPHHSLPFSLFLYPASIANLGHFCSCTSRLKRLLNGSTLTNSPGADFCISPKDSFKFVPPTSYGAHGGCREAYVPYNEAASDGEWNVAVVKGPSHKVLAKWKCAIDTDIDMETSRRRIHQVPKGPMKVFPERSSPSKAPKIYSRPRGPLPRDLERCEVANVVIHEVRKVT